MSIHNALIVPRTGTTTVALVGVGRIVVPRHSWGGVIVSLAGEGTPRVSIDGALLEDGEDGIRWPGDLPVGPHDVLIEQVEGGVIVDSKRIRVEVQ